VGAGEVHVAGAVAGVVGDVVELDVRDGDAGGDRDREAADRTVGGHVLDSVLVVPTAFAELGGLGGDDDQAVVGDEDVAIADAFLVVSPGADGLAGAAGGAGECEVPGGAAAAHGGGAVRLVVVLVAGEGVVIGDVLGGAEVANGGRADFEAGDRN